MSSRVDPLTLTREDLYELVWSKPMVELAKDFGLSDAAVAKRCRKLGVPVPGRGYWARVDAGQTPRQTPLRKRADQNSDYYALTFDSPREDRTESDRRPEPTEQKALRERIQEMELGFESNLRSASAAIKRTAVHLKRPWRQEILWDRGEKAGPIIRIEVSETVVDRALLVCERLLLGAGRLGWTFQGPAKPKESGASGYRDPFEARVPKPPSFGHLLVEGEMLAFRIDERRRQLDHVPTEEEKARRRRREYVHAPRWDFEPSGEIRLHIAEPESRYTSCTWKDGAKVRLEDKITSVLLSLLDAALRIKSNREQKRLDEIEERRKEILRINQSQRRDANAKLIRALETQAGAWLRARLLRGYLRATRRAVGTDRVEATLAGKPVDFIAWAQHYVDQLDPLSMTPHDPDLEEDRPGYYHGSEKFQEALARLVGQDWQSARKLMEPPENVRRSFDEDEDDDEEDEF